MSGWFEQVRGQVLGVVESFGAGDLVGSAPDYWMYGLAAVIAVLIVLLAYVVVRRLVRFAVAGPSVDNRVRHWGDADFVSAVHAETVHGRHRAASVLLLAIVAFFAAMFFWADNAILDEVTTGTGKVIPSSQVQVVQNLEGGIVKEILVGEGQVVKKGQILVRIDDTGFAATFGETQAKKDALRAAIARLTAEIDDRPLEFPETLVQQRPDLVRSERTLYDLRRAELRSQIAVLEQQAAQRRQDLTELQSRLGQLKRSFDLANEELELTRPLIAGGAVSRVEVLRLEREVNDLKGDLDTATLSVPRARAALDEVSRRISEKRAIFRAEAQRELNDRRASLAVIGESITAARDRVVRADVRSPVHGTVKRLLVATIGGVVRPGMDIVEIVPLEDTLLVEARIRPTDIAFLRPGQAAMVKVTAYDFSIYGGLKATVEQISADTITDDRGESFFKIRVRTDRSYLGSLDKPLPIISGMTATVDILTGSKSVLDYLLKPILKARYNALRER